MSVVSAVVALGAFAAVLIGMAVWRWPRRELASPRLTAQSVNAKLRAHPALSELAHERVDPSAATELGLTAALVTLATAAIVVGVLVAMVHTNTGLARYDLRAAKWGAANATTESTNVLRFINRFGSTELTVPLALVVSIVEFRRTRSLSVFWFMITVIVGYLLIVNGTKVIVDRTRPDIDRLSGFSGASFPSGHAAAASATFAAIALLLGRRRSRLIKAILAGAAGGIAVAVAATRVLLGVHWLTDVIGGLAIGWAWFALCSIAFGGRMLRFGQPVLLAEQLAPTASLTSRTQSSATNLRAR